MVERNHHHQPADVAELADALDSGSSARKGVEVQILSSALEKTRVCQRSPFFSSLPFFLLRALSFWGQFGDNI